jgi:drug/metabolite transporter (DMT)-like permease
MSMTQSQSPQVPPTWAVVLAFALIYISWGTTYLAIQVGVRDEHLPPALFGGVRVSLAGILVLAFQWLCGGSLRVSPGELFSLLVVSWLMFVCGNGLICVAEQTVNSGVAAVLVATTPLWLGLFSMFWPGGERLTLRGWLGLLVGLAGVPILLWPHLQESGAIVRDIGPLLVLGSAASWALGSLVLRHTRRRSSHLAIAGYQMLIGGGSLALVGVLVGEIHHLPDQVTAGAAAAFLYLLIVGSLVGFVAFNWLLGHVSATKVGTYAYVNPVVAVLVGWLAGEKLNGWIAGGIGVILLGVFLVRGGERPAATAAQETEPAVQPEVEVV